MYRGEYSSCFVCVSERVRLNMEYIATYWLEGTDSYSAITPQDYIANVFIVFIVGVGKWECASCPLGDIRSI